MAYNKGNITNQDWCVFITHYLAHAQGVKHLSSNTLRRHKANLLEVIPRIKKWDKQTAYSLYLNHQQEPITINKKIEVICAFCDYLHEEHGIDTQIFKLALQKCKVKVNLKARDILTKEEVQKLIQTKHGVLFSTLYHTGARVQEALNLVWGDISFTEKYLVFRKTKNKQDRKVYIPDVLIKKLESCRGRANNSELVFNITQQAVNKALHSYNLQLGINKQLSSHIFRRSLINHLGNDGAPLPVIRSIVGHRSMDAITHYLQVSDIKTQKQVQDRHNPILSEFTSPKDWLDSEEKRLRERELTNINNIKHSITRDGNKLVYEVWF